MHTEVSLRRPGCILIRLCFGCRKSMGCCPLRNTRLLFVHYLTLLSRVCYVWCDKYVGFPNVPGKLGIIRHLNVSRITRRHARTGAYDSMLWPSWSPTPGPGRKSGGEDQTFTTRTTEQQTRTRSQGWLFGENSREWIKKGSKIWQR